MRNTTIFASDVTAIESKQNKSDSEKRMLQKRQRALKKFGCYDSDPTTRSQLALVSGNKSKIREYIRLCEPGRKQKVHKNTDSARRSELHWWLIDNKMPTSTKELQRLLAICGQQSKDVFKKQTSKRRAHPRIARREGVVEDARTDRERYLDAVETATLRGVNEHLIKVDEDGIPDYNVLDSYVDCLVNVALKQCPAS